MKTKDENLIERATALKLYGLLAHWSDIKHRDWLEPFLLWEEASRQERSLQRRLSSARIGRFKTLVDFNWQWPKNIDRGAVEDLMKLDFMREAANVVLVGPNGVGKSTIARNIAHRAVLEGHTVLFTTAGQMLNELAAQDGDNALRRRLKYYAQASLICIDEIGYLSYSNRHADLLFEVISRRYEEKSIIITTNRPFSEWNDVFPNAACVVSLVDRLIHNAEIIQIEGESYRLKEANERAVQRKKKRSSKKSTAKET
jgi:DNA replication protein DnaC